MTRDRRATLLTFAVLAAAFGVVMAQRAGWRPAARTAAPEATPQQTIYAMLDAGRSGDAAAYVAHFTQRLQGALLSDPNLGSSLRASSAAIKGVAITEPQQLSDREVKLRVEYVYQDRNEAQFMYLERSAAGWKVTRIDPAERIHTAVPYGAPAQ